MLLNFHRSFSAANWMSIITNLTYRWITWFSCITQPKLQIFSVPRVCNWHTKCFLQFLCSSHLTWLNWQLFKQKLFKFHFDWIWGQKKLAHINHLRAKIQSIDTSFDWYMYGFLCEQRSEKNCDGTPIDRREKKHTFLIDFTKYKKICGPTARKRLNNVSTVIRLYMELKYDFHSWAWVCACECLFVWAYPCSRIFIVTNQIEFSSPNSRKFSKDSPNYTSVASHFLFHTHLKCANRKLVVRIGGSITDFHRLKVTPIHDNWTGWMNEWNCTKKKTPRIGKNAKRDQYRLWLPFLDCFPISAKTRKKVCAPNRITRKKLKLSNFPCD